MPSASSPTDVDEDPAGPSFTLRIGVRSYDFDSLDHLNQAVCHSYAEHGRVELFRAAGCAAERMITEGFAVVLLSSLANYRRELRGGDEVDVGTNLVFGTGKTFAMNTRITKLDGTLSATIDCTAGVLDLTARRLLADPKQRIAALCTNPAVLFGSR